MKNAKFAIKTKICDDDLSLNLTELKTTKIQRN